LAVGAVLVPSKRKQQEASTLVRNHFQLNLDMFADAAITPSRSFHTRLQLQNIN
jgi:hypothetical protein